MSRKIIPTILVAGGMLTIGAVSASLRWVRDPGDQHSTGVFICRESQEVFFGDISADDAMHPLTGHALAVAVYCPLCQVWQAAPPVSRLYRDPKAIKCPECQLPRTFTGDLPADAMEL